MDRWMDGRIGRMVNRWINGWMDAKLMMDEWLMDG